MSIVNNSASERDWTQLALGLDRFLVRLAMISPMAVLAFLLFESVQELGAALIIIGVAIAVLWAAFDLQ